MATSATLQNSIRVRIFLILVFSVIIRIIREFASRSVQNATALLEFNYILYGTVLICGMLPFRKVWVAVTFLQMVAGILGLVTTILGSISTARCISAGNAGCITTSPADISTLVLAGIVVLLDFYQSWTAYLILRYPSFVSSSYQRVRVLFSWALPFAWLVNIYLLIDSNWSAIVATHIIIDPTVIFMADTGETALLIALIIGAVSTDFIALFVLDTDIWQAIVVQIILSLASLGMIIFSPKKTEQNKPKEKDDRHTAKYISSNQKLHKRKIKSDQGGIAF